MQSFGCFSVPESTEELQRCGLRIDGRVVEEGDEEERAVDRPSLAATVHFTCPQAGRGKSPLPCCSASWLSLGGNQTAGGTVWFMKVYRNALLSRGAAADGRAVATAVTGLHLG